MGLEYGYDETKKKWYAKGLWFIKWYDSKEEMEEDSSHAFDEYVKVLDIHNSIVYSLAQLRYR